MHGDEKLWKKFDRKKPSDWTDLQVKGAKRALAISHAGVGSHVTATILMDPDHLIEKRRIKEKIYEHVRTGLCKEKSI